MTDSDFENVDFWVFCTPRFADAAGTTARQTIRSQLYPSDRIKTLQEALAANITALYVNEPSTKESRLSTKEHWKNNCNFGMCVGPWKQLPEFA